jgi:hypothetical protein
VDLSAKLLDLPSDFPRYLPQIPAIAVSLWDIANIESSFSRNGIRETSRFSHVV